MRLSFVCLFKKTVPGNIFRGKNRLVKPVTYSAMEHLRQEFDRQDKVMELLRYPYLTRVSDLIVLIVAKGLTVFLVYVYICCNIVIDGERSGGFRILAIIHINVLVTK